MNSRTAKILQLACMQKSQSLDEKNNNFFIIDDPVVIDGKNNENNSPNVHDPVVVFDNVLSPDDISKIINEADIILLEDNVIMASDTSINIQPITYTDTTQVISANNGIASGSSDIQTNCNNEIIESPEDEDSDEDYVPNENNESEEEYGDDPEPEATAEDETDEEEEENAPNEVTEEERKNQKSRMNKRELNKRKRMLGEKYLGFSKPSGQKNTFHNKERSERSLGQRCSCVKKVKTRRCSEVTEEERLLMFNKFWKTMTWDQRKVYVSNTVQKNQTKRPKYRENNEAPRRTGTFQYHLITENGKIPVCKTLYLNTLCLGEWTVKHWVEDGMLGMNDSTESRISKRPKRSDIFEEDKAVMGQFLQKLNKLPSHYCRKDTSKLYLEQSFQSFAQLYQEYVKFCERLSKEPLGFSTLRKMTNDMNISLFHPRKDQCNDCFKYKNKNLSQEEYETHINLKNRARQEKDTDKEQAKLGHCITLTMDVQAVKLCPHIPANALYYKTKLTCHNFTIYNIATHQCTCYWYDEITADGQASAYASFLLDYLEEHCITSTKTPVIIFSDGCTAQNRNSVLSNALLFFSEKHNISITQKFLVKGHTQMECDSVHSTIERALKHREIYVPYDYVTVTQTARRRIDPYIAKKPPYTFFLNYGQKQLMKYDSIRPGKVAHDPVVTDIHVLKYENNIIQYKLNFDDDFKELPRRPKNVDWSHNNFPNLYANLLPIQKTKFQHLQDIKQVIPKDYWDFYDSLPHLQ